MSNPTISAIQLPSVRGWLKNDAFARKLLLRIFSHLRYGSLIIREGNRVERFSHPDGLGGPEAVIIVDDPAVYRRVLAGGVLAAGESYMLGHWHSPDLVAVIRLFSANLATMQTMDAGAPLFKRLGLKIYHALNGNSQRGSRRNISAHYDVGNEFFELFLDDTMMYSAAVFPHQESTLQEASVHKLDLLCQQLRLAPEDHLLEIGTGWGGMAVYAAREYGCRVTTSTISREQYEYALDRVHREGLEDRITVLCKDYRDLQGCYDKLVSVEMIEAVGHEYYQDYFRRCNQLLRPDGLMVIQSITMADQRYHQARDSVDFIKRYIFPGGCLPSLEVISHHLAKDTDMQMIHLRDITEDYANTLAHWRERFHKALPQVRAQGFDELFERMWDFYLAYCEGGFRERIISTVQLTFAAPGYRFSV